ncbi:MAG: serine/threonine-protein kinase [Bryobacterales bacterium]
MDVADQIEPRLESAIGQRYEVLGPIGRGGMASVYLVRHRVHGGFCAVKVLADELAKEPPLVKSFLTEARASASLDEHPNIVNIVDIDEHAGLYYMIMKYIEGEDLSVYLKRKGAIPWKQAAYIASEVAEALSFSHDRGVIHRDMKPSNIRINRRGGVTVMDFGIAKVGQMPSSFTEMGARAGTPHYMAPEQIKGDKVDHRSDLYGLGVILYRMATGRLPFEGKNPAQIWQQHLHEAPTPPQEIEPSLPDPLNHIVVTLLAKNPDERYDSAARLVRHLRTLGLEGVAATLEPIDQLDLDKLRTQEIRTRELSPRSVVETGPMTTTTESKPAPPPPPTPAPDPTPVEDRTAGVQTVGTQTLGTQTLPTPKARVVPRPPETKPFQLTDSRGAWKPWTVAAALAVLLAAGGYWLTRPAAGKRPTSAPPAVSTQTETAAAPEAIAEEPAVPAEETPAPEAVPVEKAESAPPAPAPAKKKAAPKVGAVYFRSTPPGASIQVDSRADWNCQAPCWLESLPAGNHTVTARLNGYRVAIQKFDVNAGGRDQLALVMQADLISAMVASTPPGADIYIDGEKRPEKTNARIPLKPGTYRIRVVLPGVAEGEQALVVSESQMPFANFVLTKK